MNKQKYFDIDELKMEIGRIIKVLEIESVFGWKESLVKDSVDVIAQIAQECE